MNAELTEIKDDLLNIAQRIMCAGFYKVMYNRKLKRYQIHESFGRQALTLVIPYDKLDERAYVLLHKTKREHYDEIVKDLKKQDNLGYEDLMSNDIKY